MPKVSKRSAWEFPQEVKRPSTRVAPFTPTQIEEILANNIKASMPVVKRYAPNGEPITDADLFKALKADLGLSRKYNVEEGQLPTGVMGQYEKPGTIALSDNPAMQAGRPAVMAHELMHAKDAEMSPQRYFKTVPPEFQGKEHIAGITDPVTYNYIPQALDYIDKESNNAWLGDMSARADVLAKYPWLKNVKADSSNKIPTPWDLQPKDLAWEYAYGKK